MQTPKGTRDFGPAEMARRRRLEDRLRRVLRAFNFREVQTPTFEDLELFEKKAGAAIGEEIYVFKDKGGRDLCLRPELTLPVMRFYFGSDLRVEPKPLRLFYAGPCYRYDKPQEGRYREFWQLGTEIVGDPTPEGHAELLFLALSLCQAAGLGNIELRIGHLGVLRGLIESTLGIPIADQGPLMRLIDKRDVPALRAALASHPLGAVDTFLELVDDAAAARGRVTTEAGRAGLAHVDRVLANLKAFGADLSKVRFDPAIARGLDYYSGLVFELHCPDLGAQSQLLGGGEYDLSRVFGAQPVPTVGFGLGFDRLLVALAKVGALPAESDPVDVVVGALSAGSVPVAQQAATALRELDLRVELDTNASGPRRPLQRASALGARFAVLLGDREVAARTATVKNLATGAQEEASLEALASVLLERVAKTAA